MKSKKLEQPTKYEGIYTVVGVTELTKNDLRLLKLAQRKRRIPGAGR